MGIAPRRLWGWEPAEFHETVRENGRIKGIRITREPEFDLEQLALSLAVERLDADLGPHGHPMSEASSSDADPSKPGGYRYMANEAPRIDYAAQALERAQEAFYKKWPDAERAGHLWHVRRIDS